MSVTILTEENFDTEVINGGGTVLVDFWAEWCGPCRMVSPIVEQVAEERPDVKVCKVNIDEQPALAERFQVMSIPTLIVFRGGQAAGTAVGARPKAHIIKMLDE
ncbi:MAG: thioredoxin [Clostridia bacterium]|nr:thioredoxin [Clostridia bacterium]